VNDLARRYSQDRVKQARSYLKSIFDEAIEQEFLVKDPTRKLKIPKNLRPKDKQILTWEQLRSILALAARRDRLLLMLDMTDALRPSELFALRWLSFDDANTLSLTETVYRRKLRPFGKTPKSLGKVHLPDGLADELKRWKLECPIPHRRRSSLRMPTAGCSTRGTTATESSNLSRRRWNFPS
jgi:integrase